MAANGLRERFSISRDDQFHPGDLIFPHTPLIYTPPQPTSIRDPKPKAQSQAQPSHRRNSRSNKHPRLQPPKSHRSRSKPGIIASSALWRLDSCTEHTDLGRQAGPTDIMWRECGGSALIAPNSPRNLGGRGNSGGFNSAAYLFFSPLC